MKKEERKPKMENNSSEKQDGFEDSLGLTRDEIKIIESHRRFFTGTIFALQHCNMDEELNTLFKLYRKKLGENSSFAPFKEWKDLSTIFDVENKLIDLIFTFSHLNKIDMSIEEKLETTNSDSTFFKKLKMLEDTYLEIKKIIKSRDLIKKLLIEIFQSSSNFNEEEKSILKLQDNILAEGHKIDRIIQPLKFIDMRDIYGIKNNSPIANYIQEIKCFE